jgi:hypothetical protein
MCVAQYFRSTRWQKRSAISADLAALSDGGTCSHLQKTMVHPTRIRLHVYVSGMYNIHLVGDFQRTIS